MNDDATTVSRGYGVPGLAVAAIFGLFFAYDVWEAVSTLVALPAFYDAYGYGAQNVPWWLLIISVAVPIGAFALAAAIGRRHRVPVMALIFLTGLAVAAALGMSIIALEDVLRPVALILPN